LARLQLRPLFKKVRSLFHRGNSRAVLKIRTQAVRASSVARQTRAEFDMRYPELTQPIHDGVGYRLEGRRCASDPGLMWMRLRSSKFAMRTVA
jgi:hypothetical protein